MGENFFFMNKFLKLKINIENILIILKNKCQKKW